ncbi:MAG: hypothetical protein QNI91_16115 [Arenicellales bacterium]|nr:hypothetical protein [Arenicellales bacterium]
MGFIGKHWNGEYSLTVSFWLNFVVLTAAYHFTEPFLQRPFVDRPWVFITITIIYVVICRLIIYPWQVVGLLRASDKHYLVHDRAIVRYGVQAIIVISLALTVAHIIGSVQFLFVYKQKMDYRARIEKIDYSLTLTDQERLIHLKGPLGFGITNAVAQMLIDNPKVRGIVLDSEGGQIYEGRGLARLIETYGLDTYSFEGCSSACTTAFIGGNNRYLGASARLGFHQYKFDSDKIRQFALLYDLENEQQQDLALYRSKQIKSDFLEKVFETSWDDMWFPSAEVLINAGVVTGIVTGDSTLFNKKVPSSTVE